MDENDRAKVVLRAIDDERVRVVNEDQRCKCDATDGVERPNYSLRVALGRACKTGVRTQNKQYIIIRAGEMYSIVCGDVEY